MELGVFMENKDKDLIFHYRILLSVIRSKLHLLEQEMELREKIFEIERRE